MSKRYSFKETTTAGSVAAVAMPLGGVKKRKKTHNRDGTIKNALDSKQKLVNSGDKYTNKGSNMKKKTNEDIGKAVSHGIKAAGEVGDSAVKGVAKTAGYAVGLPKGLKKAYRDGKKKASGDDDEDLNIKKKKASGDDDEDLNIKKKTNENLADMAHIAEKDHEVQMARADLYKIAKYAIKLHEMLRQISEAEGLEGWQQAKITKASDYISAVYHNLDYSMKFDGAGELGEGKGKYKSDAQRKAVHAAKADSDYKKKMRENLEIRLESAIAEKNDLEEKAVSRSQQKAAGAALAAKRGDMPKSKLKGASKRMVKMSTAELEKYAGTKHKGLPKKVAESQPKPITEAEFDEAAGEKDACYHKVKSRYKVWPSAYASGALAKCRKVGAKNWGNESKK